MLGDIPASIGRHGGGKWRRDGLISSQIEAWRVATTGIVAVLTRTVGRDVIDMLFPHPSTPSHNLVPDLDFEFKYDLQRFLGLVREFSRPNGTFE